MFLFNSFPYFTFISGRSIFNTLGKESLIAEIEETSTSGVTE